MARDKNDDGIDTETDGPQPAKVDWDGLTIETTDLDPDDIETVDELTDIEADDLDVSDDDDDNPYQESDEALPDDDEEQALRRDPSREGDLSGEP